MVIFKEGTINIMSVVIAVCSNNFCTFLSDGRKVTNGREGLEVVDENAQKIFEVNPRVLVGATGWFMTGEEILDAVKRIDMTAASPKVVKAAIVSHLKEQRRPGFTKRNYIVGGKSKAGFELYKVSYDPDGGHITSKDYSPTKQLNYGVAIGLPDLMTEQADEIVSKVGECVRYGGKHETVMNKIKDIIREISAEDETVNDHIRMISIL